MRALGPRPGQLQSHVLNQTGQQPFHPGLWGLSQTMPQIQVSEVPKSTEPLQARSAGGKGEVPLFKAAQRSLSSGSPESWGPHGVSPLRGRFD